MNREDEGGSWFTRLKHFLQGEPQNQEELVSLLRDAQIRSLINSETLAMIEGSILFSKMRVRDIMLPKNQMVCIKQNEKLNDIIKTVTQTGHSRFPVTDENGEEVIGILHAKDLLRGQASTEDSFDLLDICRQVTFVPESRRLDSLLSEFRSTKNHMAIVVDEYGEVSGFVTIEDIIEQIVGDIEDEFDIDEDAYIKAHDNGHYIVKAHTPIDEFNEQLNTNFSDETYDTIGGIVLNSFGYLPTRGETITIGSLEFKIINADARRIKLLECVEKQ
ncbi:Mg2+ and Co2+ transporter CorC [Legionella drancourtii LLAP12]|uniref:Magnesium and cobalt efflux protein CorC n=1 Tax=Legionella drancourtii LLAP12 TaxID=658187 RepID=G9EUV1_9GAMM|nr:Mg2+ and Co2+ transporter CorC [Legionella drancourtii LLAP12]